MRVRPHTEADFVDVKVPENAAVVVWRASALFTPFFNASTLWSL